jgi:[ribosomal protein S18]-alanine N-acetyltransferase
VTEGGELLGYACFGAPARVAGAAEEPGVLDVGYGMAPQRTGRGDGHRFVAAILDFALDRYEPNRFRLYVLEWDQRSRKVAERRCFSVESVLDTDEGHFLVKVREAHD